MNNPRHKATYRSWQGIFQRCKNPNNSQYKHYGERGISICDAWASSFDSFLSDMGERPEGMTLDRVDNNRGYSPDNCRWATITEQNNNKRNNVVIEFNGESLTRAQWARRIGISGPSLTSRLLSGMPLCEALANGRKRRRPMEAAKGYTIHKTGKYMAQCRNTYIGLFETESEARAAYLAFQMKATP